jgi:hypothetical protein
VCRVELSPARNSVDEQFQICGVMVLLVSGNSASSHWKQVSGLIIARVDHVSSHTVDEQRKKKVPD